MSAAASPGGARRKPAFRWGRGRQSSIPERSFELQSDVGDVLMGAILANFLPNRGDIYVMVTGAHAWPLDAPVGRFRVGIPRGPIGVRLAGCETMEAIMTERLSAEARRAALAELPGWSETAGREAIARTFIFTDFNEAFGF